MWARSLITETISRWWSHGPSTLGAALAFYAVFSIGPLLVIVVAIAGLFFGQEAVQGQIGEQLTALLGETAAKATESLLAGASHFQTGVLAAVLGFCVLVFTALGVVVQLKTSLNVIWEVQEPSSGGIWNFIRSYVISLAAVISLGFLLLVSLVTTTGLAAAGKYFTQDVAEGSFQVLNSLFSFASISLLFAMMFKWLPDTPVAWRDVWLGAIVTAALFDGGEFLIGLYLGKIGLESTYAGAASILTLLLWVYYSSQIVLLGAEFTHVYARQVRQANVVAKCQSPAYVDSGSDDIDR